ncbi:hypothetical protein [Mollivirus kamchatka]|nr:hypothetical protein [Mollivirus kamchatka]
MSSSNNIIRPLVPLAVPVPASGLPTAPVSASSTTTTTTTTNANAPGTRPTKTSQTVTRTVVPAPAVNAGPAARASQKPAVTIIPPQADAARSRAVPIAVGQPQRTGVALVSTEGPIHTVTTSRQTMSRWAKWFAIMLAVIAVGLLIAFLVYYAFRTPPRPSCSSNSDCASVCGPGASATPCRPRCTTNGCVADRTPCSGTNSTWCPALGRCIDPTTTRCSTSPAPPPTPPTPPPRPPPTGPADFDNTNPQVVRAAAALEVAAPLPSPMTVFPSMTPYEALESWPKQNWRYTGGGVYTLTSHLNDPQRSTYVYTLDIGRKRLRQTDPDNIVWVPGADGRWWAAAATLPHSTGRPLAGATSVVKDDTGRRAMRLGDGTEAVQSAPGQRLRAMPSTVVPLLEARSSDIALGTRLVSWYINQHDPSNGGNCCSPVPLCHWNDADRAVAMDDDTHGLAADSGTSTGSFFSIAPTLPEPGQDCPYILTGFRQCS